MYALGNMKAKQCGNINNWLRQTPVVIYISQCFISYLMADNCTIESSPGNFNIRHSLNRGGILCLIYTCSHAM